MVNDVFLRMYRYIRDPNNYPKLTQEEQQIYVEKVRDTVPYPPKGDDFGWLGDLHVDFSNFQRYAFGMIHYMRIPPALLMSGANVDGLKALGGKECLKETC